ncbi:MAG: bifunctional phosphopantothenoylcysteine decarboxylase/phosphopantothenate--cysteine ligase CoaBC [Treponema sp.]|uniref:bifunctional phosphopantothenoylcysteine decarboxylase/phosphopantothenate--cysteine ligase CoaBC n=1 Tax=Treponema sp. TaxID=166 RepID=UPI00257A53A6|nr:bifunctional phosphopantothenoylcysteine decarboxylase/phosphopantothenate--cysteine ligase CoaBC [Treponema sp.]MBQ5536892.1 bifunctional phosphopantothenoylcysteine decarboxylase/phosphopantothenate--cysteine ligase CoaBC [Treponema sp.]
MLKDKTVLLGVTGSIAAYKAASLASLLVKNHADVHVLMTKNATNIINPIAFETLTGNKCLIDTFDRNFEFDVKHVSLAKKADIFVVAPATANVIAKIASGICDDMLTTTFLASECPKMISPAMNTRMLMNPITQSNIERCRSFGMKIIDSAEGHLACGDDGKGKMPEPEVIFNHIASEIAFGKDLKGKRILVTAGPTRERLDPVRFLSNRSTGKMGFAVARVAAMRGADVTLVSGPVSLETPLSVRRIDVESADEMFRAVSDAFDSCDIVIKAAAVADYKPAVYVDEKIKKTEEKSGVPCIELSRTEDILASLGARKKGQFLCGFSMETQDMIENSRRKLEKKNLDMIVANNLKVSGAGFGTDTNVVTIITKDGEKELPIMTKEQVASALLDEILLSLKSGMSGN